MFEQWANAVEAKIKDNGSTYFDAKFEEYNEGKDTIIKIPGAIVKSRGWALNLKRRV
jgi:hypothetical protein